MNPNTVQPGTPVLQIEHLYKVLGGHLILDDVSFETYSGEVFGFLGPNGAGKTTTIKIVTGLLTLDEGTIRVAGHDLHRDFEGALAEIGGIVENPEFYPYLSGYDTLKIYANTHKNITEERIREVIHLVGLDLRIKEKVGKYSLGMRQRLGVAQALLHRPRLLVLDEPTNGLDPAGTKALRDILKKLAHEEGISVVVSSHLMSEMEMMCDRVGMIVGGKLKEIKPISEMVSAAGPDFEEYVLRVDHPLYAKAVLAPLAQENMTVTEDGALELRVPVENAQETVAEVNRKLIESGLKLYTVGRKENRRLEDVFIEMTGTKGGGQIE